MKKISEALHSGHRKRIKQQFFTHGLQNFSQREILELLLFYSSPRMDTNPIARILLKHFGSLRNLFSSGYYDFLDIKGISKSSALYLALLTEVLQRCSGDNGIKDIRRIENFSFHSRCDFFTQIFSREAEREIFMAAAVDEELQVTQCSQLEAGKTGQVKINLHQLTQFFTVPFG